MLKLTATLQACLILLGLFIYSIYTREQKETRNNEEHPIRLIMHRVVREWNKYDIFYSGHLSSQ